MVRVTSRELLIIFRDMSHSWILSLRTFASTVIFLSGHRLAIAEVILLESAGSLFRGDDRFAAC